MTRRALLAGIMATWLAHRLPWPVLEPVEQPLTYMVYSPNLGVRMLRVNMTVDFYAAELELHA